MPYHLAGGLASLFGTLWDYLENLYISNCAPVMRPDDLVHLACFSKLVRLNIDSLRGPVEARQINHLGRLTNLQELRILFAGHGLEQNLLVCVALLLSTRTVCCYPGCCSQCCASILLGCLRWMYPCVLPFSVHDPCSLPAS